MNQEVYFVDSFTSELFRGNPAGVIFYTEAMSDGLMQKIATENNLSETAFININSNEIRFFTPEIEVDLCGHATLASAFIYFNFIDAKKSEVTFHSKRGSLFALKVEAGIQVTLPRDTLKEAGNYGLFADALNVPVNELYKGIDDYLVILDSEDTVKNLKPNFEMLKKIDARGIVVSAKGNEIDFVSRWFGPQTGVNEDPVTGSAHALLAPYWANNLGKKHMQAAQLSPRGGKLDCKLDDELVHITGEAKLYLKGKINLD
ncbi:MAG: PhzF family phenazine biosynthesis protein [SAR86 cluster bacterium]|uniref:PhzF family phenazine biosynthesis protein n=1 Tax=SAR86 cluster bacterium TaxID=2030880 RepID=A0A937LMX6_9GAMM|nr:PhzF family phenazine biosynthesis protein [SAR86 cluster bacterium]